MASSTVSTITSCLILISQCHGWISNIVPRIANGICQSSGDHNNAPLKEPDNSYGRMAFWDESYRQALNQPDATDAKEFSWYCGWDDLQPFFSELVPEKSSRILIPGIGNDGCIRDMFDYGYHRLSAFDYAPEGVECAKRIMEDRVLDDLRVADCRDLMSCYESSSFEAVFDKGTLDSVYLSGGNDKGLAGKHLDMAISELARVLKPGGIVFCVTAACTNAIQKSFDESNAKDQVWDQVRDGNLYMTEDDYASNNVDATILAWKRL